MADQLIRATAAEGGIRAVGVITTRLTEEARACRRCDHHTFNRRSTGTPQAFIRGNGSIGSDYGSGLVNGF